MGLKGAVFARVFTNTGWNWGSLLAGAWDVREQLAPEDTKWVTLLWVRAEFSSNQLGRVPRRVEDLGEFILEYTVPGSG